MCQGFAQFFFFLFSRLISQEPTLQHTPMQVLGATQQHSIYSNVLVHAAVLRSMDDELESNEDRGDKKTNKQRNMLLKLREKSTRHEPKGSMLKSTVTFSEKQ